MKQLLIVAVALMALAGCKDRVIWDDNGKLDEAREDREIWNSNGKLDTGGRVIWRDANGNDVIK